MEMPRTGEAHALLEKMAGSWSGEETMHPSPWDPDGGKATGKVSNRLALGGFAMIQDYVQERGGKTTFEGHGVLTWDGQAGEYVMHWWDSMGMPVNEFRGRLDENTLAMTHRSPQMHSRVTWHVGRPDRYDFSMEMSPDGERWSPLMSGTYARTARA